MSKIPTIYGDFFRIVVYPDSSTHYPLVDICNNLAILNCNYVYALHDKDVLVNDELRDFDFNNAVTISGIQYKKPHYHFCIFAPHMITNKMIMNCTGVEKVYVGLPIGKNYNDFVRYLCHEDEPLNALPYPKTRYPPSVRIGNFDFSCYTSKLSYTPELSTLKTDTDLILDDLALLCDNQSIDLQEFLKRHPKYCYYFKSLKDLIHSIYPNFII